MKLTTDNITQLLAGNPKSQNGLGSLVLEYAKINQQLNNIEHQSIYFQSGIESNQKRIENLKASYASTQQYIINHSIDDFISLKNEKEATVNSVNWSELSVLTKMGKVSLQNSIAYLNESIAIKRIFPTLPDLNDLINNSDDLIALINI